PAWFQTSFVEISRERVGAEYDALLSAFVEMEKGFGYAKGTGKLTTTGRPQQLTEWVRDGRGRTKEMMEIADLAGYENGWWKWWKEMQPRWRVGEGESLLTPAEYGDGWGGLTHGQNGVLSVVATLYWWGHAENTRGIYPTSGWRAAVADTLWV
ncbi:hypothetical protein B0H12DRAFT_993368, partial [Mycena haematopus]